jgi:hypothetical protein
MVGPGVMTVIRGFLQVGFPRRRRASRPPIRSTSRKRSALPPLGELHGNENINQTAIALQRFTMIRPSDRVFQAAGRDLDGSWQRV